MRSEGEREFVREAARRVLDGGGLITIARDWTRRGVPGASGGPWTAPTLRRVLLSSRIAGLREHGVDPSGKTLGDLSPAVWPAALDRQRWDQVRAVLPTPERNTNVRKATRYLLTGLIHCGVDAGTKQRIVLQPDPRAFWAEGDFQKRRDLVGLMIQRVELMPGRPAFPGSPRLGYEYRFRPFNQGDFLSSARERHWRGLGRAPAVPKGDLAAWSNAYRAPSVIGTILDGGYRRFAGGVRPPLTQPAT